MTNNSNNYGDRELTNFLRNAFLATTRARSARIDEKRLAKLQDYVGGLYEAMEPELREKRLTHIELACLFAGAAVYAWAMRREG
jgi:hypothetical protein